MAERLLNDFLLGADPEVVLIDPPTLINGLEKGRRFEAQHLYGYDHGGYVLEPHPTPDKSARNVCRNLKKSLDVVAHHFGEYRVRAGAYYSDPNTRSVFLGGHVHLDIPRLNVDQISAMDHFTSSLIGLDILPTKECAKRSGGGAGYGHMGDVRFEHGHSEYRSMCSWLFSRKTSMLCLTGIKLAAFAPDTVSRMTSLKELQTWIEKFKGKDDDVDWILNRGYFEDSLEAKPDSNVKSVWKVDPALAKGWLAEIPPPPPPRRADPVWLDGLRAFVMRGEELVPGNLLRLQQAQTADPNNANIRDLIEANARLTRPTPLNQEEMRDIHRMLLRVNAGSRLILADTRRIAELFRRHPNNRDIRNIQNLHGRLVQEFDERRRQQIAALDNVFFEDDDD